MSNVNALLNERMKRGEQSSKMMALAKQSASGNLTGFSGIFGMTELNPGEKEGLEYILKEYAHDNLKESHLKSDLSQLISITSEVKAINNQAAMLHGERIKKAQTILKRYRDGAFTTWLLTAYGNRQTPYNFLQYYDFFEAMPKTLRPQLEAMPRQAVYTLATREGPLHKKQRLVETYKGQTKNELLTMIRSLFPLDLSDKRRQNSAELISQELNKVLKYLKTERVRLSPTQKQSIAGLLSQIQTLVKGA
jgi:hypothetical protein